MRALKFAFGLLLLLFCFVVTRALWLILAGMPLVALEAVPRSVWWLGGGFAVWMIIWLVMPRPFSSYVLAHELSHVVWAWLFGGKVSGLKVSEDGGQVAVSVDNFLVTLAPYFFPFYTLIVLLVYALTSAFVDTTPYEPFWLAAVGLTWGFHLTFTLLALSTEQSDVEEHGRLFSYSVIYFMNVLGIGLWVVAIASPTLEAYVQAFGDSWNYLVQGLHGFIDQLLQDFSHK